MLKMRTKESALPYAPLSLPALDVNYRSDKGAWATHTLESRHRFRLGLEQ